MAKPALYAASWRSLYYTPRPIDIDITGHLFALCHASLKKTRPGELRSMPSPGRPLGLSDPLIAAPSTSERQDHPAEASVGLSDNVEAYAP